MVAKWIAALIFVCAMAGLAMAQSETKPQTEKPESFKAVHEALLADTDLQFERPGPREFTPPPDNEPPGFLRVIGEFFADVFGFLGPIIRYGGLVLLVAAVCWLLWFMFGEAIRMRLGWQRKTAETPEISLADDQRPDAETARSLLAEADALAAQGRFGEAVHLLLFRSIEDIQTRQTGQVPRSLTAREIGGLASLAEATRAALRPIIMLVEQSFFGGSPVGQADWTSARRSYESFAFAGADHG